MGDKVDAFGNPISDGAPQVSAPAAVPAAEARPSDAEPVAPTPASSSEPPRETNIDLPMIAVGRLVRLAIRLGVIAVVVAGGAAAVRAIGDSVEEVTNRFEIPSSVTSGGSSGQERKPTADFDKKPFGEGSMFRDANLARALRRAQKEAPKGARAVSVSVFPGYAAVTFKRRSGDATSVTSWADGRVNRTDAGSAAGRKTFSLSALPLSPMVRYVRNRKQALGKRARGPYAVVIDRTTTTISGGQVKITTRPASGWLIGFEGVPQSKRTVQIDLRGERVR